LRNFGNFLAFDIRFSVHTITTAEDDSVLFENTTIDIDTGSGTPRLLTELINFWELKQIPCKVMNWSVWSHWLIASKCFHLA